MPSTFERSATPDSVRAAIAQLVRVSADDLVAVIGDLVVTTSDRVDQEAAFSRWFGDSKVVDASGRPLVVYHATEADFEVFEPAGELGNHFGTPDQANYVASGRPEAKVLPVYLTIRNPLRLEDRGNFMPESVIPQLLDLGIVPKDGRGFAPAHRYAKGAKLGPQALLDVIESHGYDGVVYLNRREGSHDPFGPDGVDGEELDEMSDREVLDMFPDVEDSWIAFHPEQIKSALGNVGTYDPFNPDIRHSLSGVMDFDHWFKGSKVVHRGRPMVVYHRTASDFDEFDTDRGDLGSHFGTAEQAEGLLGGYMRDGERTVPVYLRIKNPLRLNDRGGFHADAVAPQLRRLGLIDKETERRLSAIGDRGSVAERRSANREIKALLSAAGYDGVVYRNTTEGSGDSFIAFSSSQIVSAISSGPGLPMARASNPALDGGERAGLVGLDLRAQAWHDAGTHTTVLLADRIPAGKERAVFLREVVHRNGRQALPEGQWDALVGQVKAWADAGLESPERAIHDAAVARVATAGAAGALADEELFAYAVEEAVARGIEPTAAAVEGSAQAWLQAVVESIQRVADKLLGNSLQDFAGQDLVDLAYALAQLDSPEHGVEVRRALMSQAEEPREQLSFRIESRDGPSGQSNLSVVAQVDGAVVGRIDYSEYRGVAAIEYISVDEAQRRRGYGTAMVMRLQQEYPDTEIKWGLLTADGAKLHGSIPKLFIQDPEHAGKSAELLAVQTRLDAYQQQSREFEQLVQPTQEQRAAFLSAVSDWNELHDAKDALEQYLAFTSPGRIVLLEKTSEISPGFDAGPSF